jgi:Ca2+-binding RTX toxin-like protein
MAIFTVLTGYYSFDPPLSGTYPTIGDAIAAALPGDTIILGDGYGPETVNITQNDITISGTSSSLGIELLIADGVSGLVLMGDAPINVTDSLGANVIAGNDGDNVMTSTGGIDVFDGGLGVDRLVVDYSLAAGVVTATMAAIGSDLGTVGITGIENYTVLTGSGADVLTFTTADGENYIDAGEGANTIVVGDGVNTVITGAGVDTITVGNGDNSIDAGFGTIGANTITAGSGNNTIFGSNGIDTIAAGGGNNIIEAGDGANTITVGPAGFGNNIIIAGSGVDTITVGSGDNYIDAGVGTIGANTITVGPTGFGNNTILGSDGIDTIVVGNGNNDIEAGDGANTITAGPTGFGNNRIIAGDGIDTITTGDGDNCIDAGSVGANTIAAGSGNNVIIAGSGIDTITVGNGNNFIDAGSLGANTVTAGSGDNYIAAGSAIDTITAMGGSNNIEAGDGANVITTGVGNDVIATGVDIDTVTSGAGNDIIKISGGADVLTAGTGHDRLIADLSTSITAVTTTVAGAGSHAGTVGVATFSSVEEFHITAGSANDTIYTGDGADVIDGGAGADLLYAGGGSDVIYGGVGDVVDGGENLDGSDFDVLVLKDFGFYEIVRDLDNPENGTVYQLDAVDGNRIGSMDFTNIESIEFADNTVTTPEDTTLEGNLVMPSITTTVVTFMVGSTTYTAGQTAERTEGSLQINSDGSYTFIPTANYNGPGPVTTYTTLDPYDPLNSATSPLMINIGAVEETTPACLSGDDATTGGTGLNGTDGDEAVSTLEGVAKTGNVIDLNLSSLDGAITVTGFAVDTNNSGSDETFVAGETATIEGVGTLMIGTDGVYILTPIAGYSGAVPGASYTLTDGNGSETSTLTIAVTPCMGENPPPAYTPVSPLGAFFPSLVAGHAIDPDLMNGIINDEYLQGDGSTDFVLNLHDTGYAWHQNVLGVYEITPDGRITDARILINNVNTDKTAEVLISDVESGNKLGFFVVQNAADWASNFTSADTFVFVGNDGWSQATVNDGAGIQLQVNGQTAWKTIFHSYAAEMNDDGIQHTISGIDTSGEMISVGFEDIVGGGDQDYEDVVFGIERVEVAPSNCDTTTPFEVFFPSLVEGQAIDPDLVNGIINDEYLQGDGSTDFVLNLHDTGYAWYQNVLGVYEITPDGRITDARILINNVNTDKTAEVLISDVESGNKLGFFVVQNAADWASNFTSADTFVFVGNDGWSQATVNDGAGIQLQVNGQTAWKTIFHSYAAEMNDDGIQHTLSGIDTSGAMISVGFEDVVGGGDQDYEDVVFSIERVDADVFLM